jgi:hypothetical protein
MLLSRRTEGIIVRGRPITASAVGTRQRAVRASVLAVAVALGGCSASELVQNWTPPPAATLPVLPDLSEPDYRRLVAGNIKTMFPNPAALGTLEISGIRRVDHLRGPAWLTCLKLDAKGTPQHYAIFIIGNKIVDSRAGIVIDRCYNETYTPFDMASAGATPEVTGRASEAVHPASGVRASGR